MSPGRGRDPLGDLALDHQHEPVRRAARRPSRRCRIGLVMWYGRFATTSYGRRHEVDEVLVQRVALDDPQRARLELRRRTSRAATATSPRSSSTAVTAAPAASSPPVRNPSPGPISSTRRSGAGSASRRIPSSTSTSARKFCDRLWRGAEAGVAEAALDVRAGRAAGRGARGRVGHRRAAAATAARPGRGPARDAGRAAAARAGRADHRPVVGAQAGARDDHRGCPRASASPAIRARSAAFAATPPPSTIPRAPTASAARIVFVASTSTTESWKPHGELRDHVVGERAALALVGRQAGVGPRLGRRSGARRS